MSRTAEFAWDEKGNHINGTEWDFDNSYIKIYNGHLSNIKDVLYEALTDITIGKVGGGFKINRASITENV